MHQLFWTHTALLHLDLSSHAISACLEDGSASQHRVKANVLTFVPKAVFCLALHAPSATSSVLLWFLCQATCRLSPVILSIPDSFPENYPHLSKYWQEIPVWMARRWLPLEIPQAHAILSGLSIRLTIRNLGFILCFSISLVFF